MDRTVARPAPSAQPPIYAFLLNALRAAEALDSLSRRDPRIPRAIWQTGTVPGSSDLCIIATPTVPSMVDTTREGLIFAGFAVGTHPASPGALFLRPPFASPACEAAS
jgi:hypothetical protein